MALPNWLGTLETLCQPHAQDNPRRSLIKINALLREIYLEGGTVSGSHITSGSAAPEGVVTGIINTDSAKHQYVQIVGGIIVRVWIFNGTAGQNTGWI